MTAPFKLVLQVRDKLYKAGILKTHRLDHPVISIGNLTLGGTGKTPLTIFLAEKMHERGFKPVVLSRGYRRRTRGTVIVSRSEGPLTPWRDAGDEPYLMAKRLVGKAAVVVGESRYIAGRTAERERLGDLFLLDDGFQHRQLHRDFDIVTIDPDEWLRGESLLPIGRWREPKRALLRADAACIQNGGYLNLPIPEFKVLLAAYGIDPPTDFRGKAITAFAGIAKPERFFEKLESMGVRVTRQVSFPDHHDFTDAELAGLGGDLRITTEKDAVRLEGRGDFCTLRVSATIAEFDRLADMILPAIGHNAMQLEKILIRGPNWVGDSVLAIPAMKAVRSHFPNAEITLLVRPWVAGLFGSASFINIVWTEPRPSGVGDWSRITRDIRQRRFDLALLFPNSFESALMMFLGRVPVRLGYATDGRSILLTDAVTTPEGHGHQVHYYLDLVKNFAPMEALFPANPWIEIQATPEEKTEARRLLASEGISETEPFLVLNPGAAYGSAKRWSGERFAEAGDRLSKYGGFRIVIVGSKSETASAEEIRSHSKSAVTILTGKTTLETLIGVLAEASLMITNDSGPMHIAAALGTPTVAVFGPTDERVTAPYGVLARIVKHPVDCSPCLLRECPIDHRCMTRVGVDDVCRAAMELLSHA